VRRDTLPFLPDSTVSGHRAGRNTSKELEGRLVIDELGAQAAQLQAAELGQSPADCRSEVRGMVRAM
jgi:hypothetical protein